MNSPLEALTHSTTLDLPWAQAVGYSHLGKVRSTNEDRFLLDAWPEQEGILAVVADGMGGNSAGDIAAQLAIATFTELLTQPLPQTCQEQYDALLAKCYLADERIRREGASSFKTLGMGTTIVAAILTPSTCVHLFAGDSRLYHFHQGHQQYRTADHSIVQMLLDAGRIQPEDIPTHPMRSVINSCLGGKASDGNFAIDPKWNEADSPIISFTGEDLILLCSDGLSSYLPSSQFLELTAQYHQSPLALNQHLLQTVLDQSKASDNITLLTLAINSPRISTTLS